MFLHYFRNSLDCRMSCPHIGILTQYKVSPRSRCGCILRSVSHEFLSRSHEESCVCIVFSFSFILLSPRSHKLFHIEWQNSKSKAVYPTATRHVATHHGEICLVAIYAKIDEKKWEKPFHNPTFFSACERIGKRVMIFCCILLYKLFMLNRV